MTSRLSIALFPPCLSVLTLLFVFFFETSARSETILADLSERTIQITSNYTGSDIVVFGQITRDRSTISRHAPYDIVIVMHGDKENLVSRRKERVVGVWINKSSRKFQDVSGFYALASTRDLKEIATDPIMFKLKLGTDNLLHKPGFDPSKQFRTYDPYREAALRLKRQAGLYSDNTGGVTFLSDTLFRSTINIPDNVAVGQYDVDVYLFCGGVLLDRQSKKLSISKAGFEQFTFALSREHGVIYGLIAVLIAVTTGWLIGIIFRKN